MNLYRLFVTSAAVIFATALGSGPCFSRESEGRTVLKKWDGQWKHHTVVKPAVWTPVGAELTGTSTVHWILNGRFQQVDSRSADDESREIHRFDADSGRYHKWAFDSNGTSSFWIGAWEAASATMTWKYIDFGLGIEGKIVDRFTGDDRCETTLILKDSQGNVLLDFQSQLTRTGGRQE